MNKYVLMQAPKKNEKDCTPQILIIDNSTHIGKNRVERLANEGYRFAGTVETDPHVVVLRDSICQDRIERLEAYNKRMREISQLASDALTTI